MGIISKWMKFAIGGGYDSISSAYFARMTTQPSVDLKRVIDTYFVKNSKVVNGNTITAKSITAKADVLYLPFINNSNDSFINLVKNAHHGTMQGGGLVFDPYWGWSNPAGTGYVDTNYNPATQGVNVNQNSVELVQGIASPNTDTLGADRVIIGAQQGSVRLTTNKETNNVKAYLNSNSNMFATVPFVNGLFSFRRTASNSGNISNQNISKTSSTVATTGFPSLNMFLFGVNKDGVFDTPFYNTINFVYIGAPLTDDEFTALNLIVNECLKECLYLKYGADNWGVKMAKSYFDTLHNFEPYEAWEIYEFIKRHQPDYVDSVGTGYLYNTFGPNGQNKTVADYIMLFKAGGNLGTNAWLKTGAILRWNQDGSITSSNTMPAYTRGANLGIITVTSTDGWNGSIIINQSGTTVNCFYGNLPRFDRLYSIAANIYTYGNRSKLYLMEQFTLGRLYCYATYFPGYIKLNVNNVRPNGYLLAYTIPSESIFYGDLSLFTTISLNQYRISPSVFQDNLIGGLHNISQFADTFITFEVSNSGITKAPLVWNRNIGAFGLTNCKLTTAELDGFLLMLNTFFGGTPPVKNLALNLGGDNMGIPTGGANNPDLLGIVAKHIAAGFTATITIRTS